MAAERPWAYLMSSAQKQVLDEVRAQQLLTDTASIRGRARQVLPGIVRPVGTTASDLAAAFWHEIHVEDAGGTERQVVPQIGRHDQAPMLTPPTAATEDEESTGREAWFVAFVDLLAEHGADNTVTAAAMDRLADLFAASYVGWWEWAARPHPRQPRLVPGSVRRPRRLAGRLPPVSAQRQARQPAGRRPIRHRERPSCGAVAVAAAPDRRLHRPCRSLPRRPIYLLR